MPRDRKIEGDNRYLSGDLMQLLLNLIMPFRMVSPDAVKLCRTLLAEFYIANKQELSERVILPVTNIGAYLGSSSLGGQNLSKIPLELMERKQSSSGRVCIRCIYENSAVTVLATALLQFASIDW